MVLQEVFDKVYDHFVTKKNPPSMSDGICRLKQNPNDPNSPRCAVGLFISEYTPSMEDDFLQDLMDDNAIPKIEDRDESSMHDFWCRIQATHDISALSPDFHVRVEEGLHGVALLYELKEITK